MSNAQLVVDQRVGPAQVHIFGTLRAVHVGRRVLGPMEVIHKALKEGIPKPGA
jgi:hypothetical protein